MKKYYLINVVMNYNTGPQGPLPLPSPPSPPGLTSPNL